MSGGMMMAATAFALSMVVNLYQGLALMLFWNWFGAPAFNSTALSYWQAFGLQLIPSVFIPTENRVYELRWTLLFNAIDLIVPELKAEELKFVCDGFTDKTKMAVFFTAAERVFGLSATLAIGWVVHSLS